MDPASAITSNAIGATYLTGSGNVTAVPSWVSASTSWVNAARTCPASSFTPARPLPDTAFDFASSYRFGEPFFIPVDYFDQRIQFNDNLSAALIVEQPFGADILYGSSTPVLDGTRVEVNSTTYTALLRYKFDENLASEFTQK